MKRGPALAALAGAFHGVLGPEPDWSQLLEIANQALVTPSLHQALMAAGLAQAIPPDVGDFFALITERNRQRNLKLRTMALEAVEAINSAGVTPVFLKGMAVWASRPAYAEDFPRMMSDVDLLVRPDEGQAALDALQARGFKVLKRYPEDSPHVVAELWRESDAGAVDLHHRPPGPAGLVAAFDPERDTEPTPWPGRVRTPSPSYQIYLTCLHDMVHEDGFWRGGFDVRHLCDIADLANRIAGVDWAALQSTSRSRRARHAILSEVIAAHRIVGALIPDEVLRPLIPRMHYQRHRLQYSHPRLHLPLALLGFGLEALQFGGTLAEEGRPPPASLAGRAARLSSLVRPDEISRPNKL